MGQRDLPFPAAVGMVPFTPLKTALWGLFGACSPGKPAQPLSFFRRALGRRGDGGPGPALRRGESKGGHFFSSPVASWVR